MKSVGGIELDGIVADEELAALQLKGFSCVSRVLKRKIMKGEVETGNSRLYDSRMMHKFRKGAARTQYMLELVDQNMVRLPDSGAYVYRTLDEALHSAVVNGMKNDDQNVLVLLRSLCLHRKDDLSVVIYSGLSHIESIDSRPLSKHALRRALKKVNLA